MVATQDNEPKHSTGEAPKVRLSHEHSTGIIVPRWWRGNIAVILGVIAGVSIVFSFLTLDQASERIAEQQKTEAEYPEKPSIPAPATTWYRSDEPSPDLPLDALAKRFSEAETVPEESLSEEEPARAYEEPLPEEMYEEAPVIQDATGERVEIPEEYIPEPILDQGSDEPMETAISTEQQDNTGGRMTEGTADQESLAESELETEAEAEIGLKSFEYELLEQQQAWLSNAIPFTPDLSILAPDAPMIAIVIDDMGVDRRRSPRAIALPGPLTLSFLTYAKDLDSQTMAALDAGHELMIHIPMEPGSSTVDPGPNVLRVEDSIEQTRERLLWGLAQFDGYVGLNNHMGSKFTQDSEGVRVVMEEVRNRGLLFLDSRTAAGSVAAEVAHDIGVPFATRNVFLDHVDGEDEIRKRLAQTERLARKNGAAVAIGHPHDATLNVLEEWLPGVAGKGFMLVPMSELVRRTWLKKQ